MKTTLNKLREMTGEEFAVEYDLNMSVNERPSNYNLPKFFASLDFVEIVGNGVLISPSGNGETPEQAVADYWPQISEKQLNLKGGKRIFAPRLIMKTYHDSPAAKMEVKPTPTPWHVAKYSTGAEIYIHPKYSTDGIGYGSPITIASAAMHEDAELIVRAVNAHEGLVEALKCLLLSGGARAIEKAQAALALAEKGTK